jgi:enoyl-[acyl-carrier protein] reductase I
MLNLEGRTAVVFGLANKRSIAWAIAQKLHAAGVNLAVSYQNERLRADAEDLVADLSGAQLFQCDVSKSATASSMYWSTA